MRKALQIIPVSRLILIILVGTAVYLTSLSGEFVWDDVHFITGNTYLRDFRHLPRILAEDVAAGSGQTYNYYRPLTVISYLIDYSFWNLNPVGYHISSVFAHLLGSDGETLDVDDGLWVDPLTLQPGDSFLQVHRFSVPEDRLSAGSAVAVGLYDPKTGERWQITAGDHRTNEDLVVVPLGDAE